MQFIYFFFIRHYTREVVEFPPIITQKKKNKSSIVYEDCRVVRGTLCQTFDRERFPRLTQSVRPFELLIL